MPTLQESATLSMSGNTKSIESDFGPHKYGSTLTINANTCTADSRLAIDIETDERDHFVGAAVCNHDSNVSYITDISLLKEVVTGKNLIGHNLKGDMRWLRMWGIIVDESDLFYDTMIASYVQNANRPSHGLKPLAKELLAFAWPTYSDIVTLGGKSRRRVTLEKQPIELVSRYCGMDCLATWKLYSTLNHLMTADQRRIFDNVEMPLNRLLFKMETKGVRLAIGMLDELDTEFSSKLKSILGCIKDMTTEKVKEILRIHQIKKLKEKWEQTAYKALSKTDELNPASWQQKKFLLNFIGITVESTDKKNLLPFKGNKLVDLLLEHSEFAKLYNTFIKAFKALPTLPYVHTTFNQVVENNLDEDEMHGIRTGRLSSKQPNLQQIPRRTENGKKLRKMFIAESLYTFVVADYGQIEKRLQCHFSGDEWLTKIFRDDSRDIFDETAQQLSIDRDTAKTMHYALDFGCSDKRLASVLRIPEDKAGKLREAYWQMFHGVYLWKDKTIREARQAGGVKTIIGRWRPVDVERLTSFNDGIRYSEERRTISKKIQGSAADIIKLAMLELDGLGYDIRLTVHDELVIQVKDDLFEIAKAAETIENVMVNAVTLDIPLTVEVGHGYSWGDAKP